MKKYTSLLKRVRLTGRFMAGLAVMLIAVASVAAVSFAGAETPWGSQREKPGASVGLYETVTSDGVELTLESVRFTSSETVLTFAAEFENEAEKNNGQIFITGLTVDGAIEDRKPLYSVGAPPGGQRVITVTLGPITDPEGEVHVTIDKLSILGAGDRASDSPIDGPWRYAFVPGPDAVDPVDIDMDVNSKRTSDDITVTVNDLHISSSGITIRYELSASGNGNFLGRSNYPARMIFPDGSWEGGRPSQDDPAKVTGDLEVSFPHLPDGVTHFTLEFGPYMETVAGPYRMDIPLTAQAKNADAGESVYVGSRAEMAGETIEATSLSVPAAGKGFSLALTNVNSGARTLIPDTRFQPTAKDSEGREFRAVSMGGRALEDERGVPSSGTRIVNFGEDLKDDAAQLTLEIPSLARLIYGSWSFEIELPKE